MIRSCWQRVLLISCVWGGRICSARVFDKWVRSTQEHHCHGRQIPYGVLPFADLNELPFEDRGLGYDEDKVLRNMAAKQFSQWSRCPYRCTYCHNHVFNERFKSCGPIVRQKKVDYIIEEINRVKASYPLRRVVFYDDTFILNKKWLRGILRALS